MNQYIYNSINRHDPQKIDMEGRVVSKEEAELRAKEYNCQYFETSAKNKLNVDACFESVMRIAGERKKLMVVESGDDLKNKNNKKGSGKCFIL